MNTLAPFQDIAHEAELMAIKGLPNGHGSHLLVNLRSIRVSRKIRDTS